MPLTKKKLFLYLNFSKLNILGFLLCWPSDHFIALSMCYFLPVDSEVLASSQRANIIPAGSKLSKN